MKKNNHHNLYPHLLKKLLLTKKLHIASIIVLMSACFSSLWSQPIAKTYNDLNAEAIRKSDLDERVLLITDREIYLCGEDIVFEAYIYEGNWFLPVQMSSVVYIELYNQENIVISKVKFFVTEGRCSGIISIPRDIRSDIYIIRAYTNYMKNFGVQQFFTQKLKIVNPFHDYSVISVPPEVSVPISCQVFPEGGILVEGIMSKVACRFTDRNDKGINVEARLMDMNKNTIDTFRTYKNGFTGFNLLPEPGKSYFIEESDGKTTTVFPLPKPLKSGLILTVDTLTEELLRIRISSNDKSVFPVRLDALRDGFVYPLIDTLIYSPGLYEISTARIPSGLVQLKLTNSEGKSLSVRLLYLKPLKKIQISLKTGKEDFNNRDNVEVMINARNDEGIPFMANLTLVSKLSVNGSKESDYAFPDVDYLNQELKQIYKDDDLIKNACSDNKLLNLLMYSAQDSPLKITRSGLKYLPEIGGDIISGKVLYKNGTPAKGIKVVQSFIGNTSSLESSVTDNNGNFWFLTNPRNNKGDLILKVENTDMEISVILDDEFYEDFPPPSGETFCLNENEIKFISKQFIYIQVDDAYSAENKNKTAITEPEKLLFYGKEYVEYHFPDYLKLPNMKEFIYEVIEGVTLSKENGKEVINILEADKFDKIGPNPLIIIDGVPVTESSIVIGLPSEMVKSIRVVRNKYFYKDQIFDGILDITTYPHDASSFDFPAGTFRYNFMHPGEENILVTAKSVTGISGRVPIYKNLLYWNPDVRTDKDGSAKVSFMAPDNSGIFEIRCFCISSEGIAGEGRINIRVGK